MKKNALNIFNDLFDDNFSFFQIKNDLFNLRTNIKEMEDVYLFEINVAGVKRENISIDVEEGYLVVGVDEKNNDTNCECYLRKEIVYKSCKRKYYIGNVSEDKIKASLNDGILYITVPKENEDIKSSKIEIK